MKPINFRKMGFFDPFSFCIWFPTSMIVRMMIKCVWRREKKKNPVSINKVKWAQIPWG